MRAKTFVSTLSCVAIMACGTAFGQTKGKMMSGPYKGPMGPVTAEEAPAVASFYTNLTTNPCVPGQKYSTDNGYFFLGPNNCFAPGSIQWIAYPFVAGHTGTVAKVQLSITNDTAICTPTSSKITVAIYSDSCMDMPVTQLGNAVNANVPTAPPGLATANFGLAGVSLTQGVQYWVVVTTSAAASQNGDTAVWWEATPNVQSFNLNDTNGWQPAPLGGPGGFSVQ